MYIAVKRNPPCNGCGKRHVKCHGTCPDYKDFLMEKDAEYKKMTSAYAAEYGMDDYEIQRTRKIQKRSNRRNG